MGPPHILKRFMCFVDGENFTCRGQDLLSETKMAPIDGTHWAKDKFMWIPGMGANLSMGSGYQTLELYSIRSYYYTSVQGDDLEQAKTREALWKLGFMPRVFKKMKSRASKGVDICLTKDMLSHAFQNHYDVALLIAGDGDYVPLVEEVEHSGKRVIVNFFNEQNGLNPDLRTAIDQYTDITEMFIARWKEEISRRR